MRNWRVCITGEKMKRGYIKSYVKEPNLPHLVPPLTTTVTCLENCGWSRKRLETQQQQL